MPIQRFAPMTKRFPSFDCDAHVAEPPWIWDRAKEWLTPDEFDALLAETGLPVMARYFADGASGRLNLYGVVSRPMV